MIYFIQFEENGPIKIGTTVHFPSRMKQHGTVSRVLGVHDGGIATEREVHDRFDHLRLNRRRGKARLEWFKPDPELLDYIARCCRHPDLLDQLHETRSKLRPVRVDLPSDIHYALRRAAAEDGMSMAAFARKVLAERLGFKDDEPESK